MIKEFYERRFRYSGRINFPAGLLKESYHEVREYIEKCPENNCLIVFSPAKELQLSLLEDSYKSGASFFISFCGASEDSPLTIIKNGELFGENKKGENLERFSKILFKNTEGFPLYLSISIWDRSLKEIYTANGDLICKKDESFPLSVRAIVKDELKINAHEYSAWHLTAVTNIIPTNECVNLNTDEGLKAFRDATGEEFFSTGLLDYIKDDSFYDTGIIPKTDILPIVKAFYEL